MKIPRKILATIAAAALAVGMVGCSSEATGRDAQLVDSQQQFEGRTPPDVTGDAEYENYVKAQEDVYDDPASIIWCTVYPDASTAPIFTVPIAGKLTSSSVSYYPSQSQKFSSGGSFTWSEENQSVDGMYHGSPPPYRYGFTPGGQYVDFFNLPTFCTTQLTEFQRQTLQVAQVALEDTVTQEAEELLKAGDPAAAQELIDGIGQ